MAQTRLYCTTSAHSRVIDFKTSNADVIALVVSADTTSLDPSDFNTGFTALTDHTANLPSSANGISSAVYYGQSITDRPFYNSGNDNPWLRYRWTVRGWDDGSPPSWANRWECDDDGSEGLAAGVADDTYLHTTLHQVWVELAPAPAR